MVLNVDKTQELVKQLQQELDQYKSEVCRLKSIINHLPGSIYWKNKDGVYLGRNLTSAESMKRLGFPWREEDIVGKTDYDLFDKGMADQYRNHDIKVMNSEQTSSHEEVVPLTDKTIIQLSTKAPFYDEKGQVAGMVGNTVDITYLKEIEKELRDSKDNAEAAKVFLKNITESLPQYVFWKDLNSVYLGCNKNFSKLVGLNSPEEIVGKTDIDLNWQPTGHSAEAFQKGDQATMAGQPITNHEEILALADGKVLITLVSKLPIIDRGKIMGIVGYFTDITDIKQKEKELIKAKQAKQQALQTKEEVEFALANIIANMPGYVYWKNREGIYLGCNNRQAQSLGLQYGSEVIGKTDFELPWTKKVATTFRENDIRIMESGEAETIEENAQVAGREAIVLSQKTPLRNKDGQVVGILGVSIDITERKKFAAILDAKEKAEAANKAKTEFLENMRHDIRTPLIGITGLATLIAEEVTNPRIKGYLDNLQASSCALMDLLNEILEVVRVSSGELPMLKKKFALKKRLIEVIKLCQAKAQQKQLNLIFDYDPNIPPYLIGDSTRVHRLILELVANALNFTHKGTISLITQLAKTEEREVIIKIIVEDTGIGMETDKQQEIFLQFKRLNPAYGGLYKGAGLGLAIVKQFIDELQGEIYVESQVGVGSKFTCIIPFRKSLLEEELGSEDGAFVQYPNKNYPIASEALLPENTSKEKYLKSNTRVLLVEDQQIAAIVVMNILTSLGCRVDLAQDGQTAIRLAQENTYDIIFMDIGLPDADGYEVTRRIRLSELNKGTHMPIIALTAHVDEENKQQCITAGMDGVYLKPLTKSKAAEILDNFFIFREKNSTLPY